METDAPTRANFIQLMIGFAIIGLFYAFAFFVVIAGIILIIQKLA